MYKKISTWIVFLVLFMILIFTILFGSILVHYYEYGPRFPKLQKILINIASVPINFENIIKVFFENHDPTQGMRQGNDIGTQYRSCIYTNNEDHYLKSLVLLKKFQSILQNNNLDQIITTEIKKNVDFFYAEDYHQQYLAKNPQGYCGIQGLGLDLDII